MDDKTATQVMMDRHAFELRFGVPPREIETEEGHLLWVISQIEKQARQDAEPYIKRLVEIEQRKPMKPIFLSLDELPAHMFKPTD